MHSATNAPEPSEPLVKLVVRRPNGVLLFATEPMSKTKSDDALLVFKYSFDRFMYEEIQCADN